MLKDTREVIGETAAPVLVTLFWIGIVAVFLAVLGYGIHYFAAPASVAIENRTFHQSQPYQDGMARDLDNWRMAYADASAEGKQSIRAAIRHRFAGYDASTLPMDDRAFLSEMKQ